MLGAPFHSTDESLIWATGQDFEQVDQTLMVCISRSLQSLDSPVHGAYAPVKELPDFFRWGG
jgi:hypothetical protein